MVARRYVVRHQDSTFDVDYDTDDGLEVLKFQLFSLTSIPPDHQKIVGGDDDRVVSRDDDLLTIGDRLKLVSLADDEDKGGAAGGNDGNNPTESLMSDEELARMLQAEEEALMLQLFRASGRTEEFEQLIRRHVSEVLMYEDPVRQEAARKTVPVEELEEKALIALAKEGNFKPSKTEQGHAFLLQLLFWFKQSFSWVNAPPPCDGCGNETIIQEMGTPLPLERHFGASRVERYRCTSCSRITRFPRYNDLLKLLETRRGRCGEWANCFTLYCRAFGYESRLILDFNDHVWTECFSQHLGRWMHLDPCEGAYDRPLLYEKGWNKKVNYVIAIAKDGVYDVTKRYTRKWPEVLSRRNITTEPALSASLAKITKECRRSVTPDVLSKLENRDRIESEELGRDLRSTDDESISLPGRQSGDKEWRISRSEIGSNESSSSISSSCPIRVCIDEHVTRIYNALSHIVSRFVKNSLSETRVVEILKIFKGILVDLKKSPYKTRRTPLNPFVLHLLSYFDELLDTLSLKCEMKTNGEVEICLADDPIKTALTLPVTMDALDDVMNEINICESLPKASLSLPLMKLNRIHSGSVVASGEELPFGIATSAFDGLCESKWEEPNGARGSWIMYKSSESQMHELVAYEIMSANDAPERDPMDWLVEGSVDGGSSWCLLDEQTSQVFQERFQRKSFQIRSDGLLCNAFRFRFLAVKDVQSTSRLQLGSIDLYARSS